MVRSDFIHIPKFKDKPRTSKPPAAEKHRVVIVGGGPVGLSLALDLGKRGVSVVLLNQFDFIPGGSKGICYSKRTLDIWNRLGVAHSMLSKGVQWNLGKVFRGANPDPIYEFDLLPIKDQEMPAFINLQQYYVEDFLVDAVEATEAVDLRWGHRVIGLDAERRLLSIETEDGEYEIEADWIVACDGSKSSIRSMMGLSFEGRVFEDNFLIADIKINQSRDAERWFWFEPPWPGASALMHRQPDDIWRLDFQLGWDIDREAAVRPENVEPFVRGMLGDDIEFEREWYSVYTFQCRRMKRFVHGRIIFAGDAAHLVSPFGARGANSGVADADNLGWKLAHVLAGGDQSIIETYNAEATFAADENILNSTRSTDFLTPKSSVSRSFRDAVLDLSEHYDFARPFVNSGRLSMAVSYSEGPLAVPDEDTWESGVIPGAPALDAPLNGGWLLNQLGGEWKLITGGTAIDAPIPVLEVASDLAKERFSLEAGCAYLIRPDQYVAGRWKNFSPEKLETFAWLL